jgi:hypothetical protein
MIQMLISGNRNWLFGSFLIFAENQFIARRTHEILMEQAKHADQSSAERTGVLTLPGGEVVQWANLDLPYKKVPGTLSDSGLHHGHGGNK